jgi:plastocyanin
MRFSAGAVAVLLLASCGDGGSEPGGLVVARAAPSGDGQSGPPGQALLSPLRVRVTRDGQPEAGAAVTWAAVGAGASIAPPANVTGPDGIAEASWTLPTAAGAATASATVTDAGGSPVTFTATATAPGQVAIEVGNNFFDPDARTVIAGTTVVWTWTGTGLISHSVESTGAPGFPSSATLAGNGQSYSNRFDAPGTYTYQCAVHGAAMSGTITVQ